MVNLVCPGHLARESLVPASPGQNARGTHDFQAIGSMIFVLIINTVLFQLAVEGLAVES